MNRDPEPRPWEILDSEYALDHRWYKVRREKVRLPNGQVLDDYFTSVRPEIALVFAVHADGQVELVRQYKHGPRVITLEFPGGIVDENGETPLEAAQRELREECGAEAGQWQALGAVYDDPSKQNNRLHLFLAQEVRRVGQQKLDHSEFVQQIQQPLEAIPKLIATGEICNAGALALAFRAMQALDMIPQ